jgi:hypothetical protein
VKKKAANPSINCQMAGRPKPSIAISRRCGRIPNHQNPIIGKLALISVSLTLVLRIFERMESQTNPQADPLAPGMGRLLSGLKIKRILLDCKFCFLL